MTNTTRWAATAAAILALSGGSQCHAFLAPGRVVLSQQQACRSSSCTSRSSTVMSADGVDLSASSTAVVAEVDDSSSGSTSSPASGAAPSNDDSVAGTRTEPKEGGTKDAAKEAGRRWIKEMKAGDKVIGYVADTTKFAAFVDCSVVRRGAKVRRAVVWGGSWSLVICTRSRSAFGCYSWLVVFSSAVVRRIV